MLRPDGAHPFVRRQLAARDFLLGGCEVCVFLWRALNHWRVRIEQYHMSDFVLPLWGKTLRGLNGAIKQFGHGSSFARPCALFNRSLQRTKRRGVKGVANLQNLRIAAAPSEAVRA
jgi:hypothetical protein